MQISPTSSLTTTSLGARSNSLPRRSSSSEAPNFSAMLSLSQEGQRKVDQEQMPAWAQQISNSLRAEPNPAIAMDIVKQYAVSSDEQLVSLEHSPDGIHGVTYSSSGLPVTPESTAAFEAARPSVQSGRMALFASESAKGTNAADIFDKLQHFMATQPESYLQKINWHGAA